MISKEYILYIDTTSIESVKVGLELNGEENIVEHRLDKRRAQAVLPLIDKLLSSKNLTLKDITAIRINQGPGSYTGIRVGLTIANTLAFLLKVPINEKPLGELAEPQYN